MDSRVALIIGVLYMEFIRLYHCTMAIQLREALNITEDTERFFSIKFVSFDKNRKKESEKIFLPTCVRVGASHNRKANDTIVVQPIDRNVHPYTVHIHLIQEVNGQEVFI